MSASPTTRRAVAEMDFGEGQSTFKIGTRSIHQFWHLFAVHFRHVLLAPQRRPDSGKVAWTWREAIEKSPVTATELTEVRRRLTEANRSLEGGFGGADRDDDVSEGLEAQVRTQVREMVNQLTAQRDLALSAFVCRTDAGLMLHSWGASVAAQPYYPDAQAGEISGTLFVGTERPAGVTVVLENSQGANVARVKSDKEGGFRFPSVASGSYRIRVADRSDFSGSEVAVTMERDSITGLELRSNSTEPISVAAAVMPSVNSSIPWYKRRLIAAIVLLLILGGGVFAWRSMRFQPASDNGKSQSSGWQSAKGQLTAGDDSKSQSTDDRKVREEAAFSTLSNSISAPKLLIPRHTSAPSDGVGQTSDRPSAQSDDGAVSPKSVSDSKNLEPGSAGTPARHVGNPAQSDQSKSQGTPTNPTGTKRTAEDSTDANAEGDDSKSRDNKLGESSRGAASKKRPVVAGASQSATDETPSDSASSGGQPVDDDPRASAPAISNSSKSPKAVAAKSPAASGKSAGSPVAENSTETGTSDSSPSANGAAASGQLQPAPGRRAKESAKGTNLNGAAATPAEAAGSVGSGEATAELPAADPASDKNGAKSARPKKTPAAQSPSQSQPNEEPSQKNADETPTPAVAAPAKKIAKNPAPTPGKSLAPSNSKHANDSPDSNDSTEPEQSSSSESSDVASHVSSASQTKQPKKQASPAFPPAERETAEAESPVALPPIIPATPTVALVKHDESSLIKIGKFRASTWKPRLMQDVIIPTHPVTAAEEETLEALRKKLLQERTASMPVAFQRLRTRSGFAFEFSGGTLGGRNQLRWRNDAGAEPPGSTVHDQHAELEWSGTAPTPDTSYSLSYPDGRTIARVTIDQAGAPVLQIAAEVRAWYWTGVENGPAHGNDSTRETVERRFDWRLFSGASIPTTWLRDDNWLNGWGQRIELPLDTATKRVGNYQIVLVDPVTGWGMVNDITAEAP